MWFCLRTIICLYPAPIKSLRTSLPGELRLALHAPNPGWLACLITTIIIVIWSAGGAQAEVCNLLGRGTHTRPQLVLHLQGEHVTPLCAHHW